MLLLRDCQTANEPEVADLYPAFRVDEDVRGLEVAMDETEGVEVVEGGEELVEGVLVVTWGQDVVAGWSGEYPVTASRSASISSKTR